MEHDQLLNVVTSCFQPRSRFHRATNCFIAVFRKKVWMNDNNAVTNFITTKYLVVHPCFSVVERAEKPLLGNLPCQAAGGCFAGQKYDVPQAHNYYHWAERC